MTLFEAWFGLALLLESKRGSLLEERFSDCQRSPNNGQLWSSNIPHPSLMRSRRNEFV